MPRWASYASVRSPSLASVVERPSHLGPFRSSRSAWWLDKPTGHTYFRTRAGIAHRQARTRTGERPARHKTVWAEGIRMRKFGVTFVVLLVGALTASAPANAEVVECGHYDFGGEFWTYDIDDVQGVGIFNVVGRDVSCSTARRISRRAFRTNPDGRGRWRYGRWSCRWRSSGIESANLRCVRGRRLVKWTEAA